MKKILVFTVCTILTLIVLLVLIASKKNDSPRQKKIPYPTGIFAEQVAWKDEHCFYFSNFKRVSLYCLDKEVSELFEFPDKYENYIFREITISKSYICDTYNFQISEPNQIATIVHIYNIENGLPINTKETNLTLKVLNCEDELQLTTSFNFLEEKYYLWKMNSNMPEEKDPSETSEQIIQNGETTTLKYGEEEYSIKTFGEVKQFWLNSNKDKIAVQDSENEIWILEN
ncbi:MAG: hypothetical protein ABIC57_01265 [bacterium]